MRGSNCTQVWKEQLELGCKGLQILNLEVYILSYMPEGIPEVS